MEGAAPALAAIFAGLTLIFFGYAVARPALAAALFLQLAPAAAASGAAQAAAYALATAAAAAALLLEQDTPAFGGALGAAVGLSFGGDAPAAAVGARVAAVALVFARLFALVPEEVVVYVTAYGGSYMLWQGLAVLDGDVWEGARILPGQVDVNSVDMWFNILSFLLVGLIGVCTQIILLRNQMFEAYADTTYEYVEIP